MHAIIQSYMHARMHAAPNRQREKVAAGPLLVARETTRRISSFWWTIVFDVSRSAAEFIGGDALSSYPTHDTSLGRARTRARRRKRGDMPARALRHVRRLALAPACDAYSSVGDGGGAAVDRAHPHRHQRHPRPCYPHRDPHGPRHCHRHYRVRAVRRDA